MFREQRIAITIFLIFLIYGISSYFSVGALVTPFFMSKLIVALATLVFLFMNLKLKQGIYLVFCFLAMLSVALVDDFTVAFLSERTHSQLLLNLTNNSVVIYASFFTFFVFFYTAIFLLHAQKKSTPQTGALLVLLTTSVVLLFFQQYLAQYIVFTAFLVLFVFLVSRLNLKNKSVLHVISAVFMMQFLLEIFKYFV